MYNIVYRTKSAADCLRFGKFPTHICEYLVAPPIDGTTKHLMRCKGRPVL